MSEFEFSILFSFFIFLFLFNIFWFFHLFSLSNIMGMDSLTLKALKAHLATTTAVVMMYRIQKSFT